MAWLGLGYACGRGRVGDGDGGGSGSGGCRVVVMLASWKLACAAQKTPDADEDQCAAGEV